MVGVIFFLLKICVSILTVAASPCMGVFVLTVLQDTYITSHKGILVAQSVCMQLTRNILTAHHF